MPDQYAKETPSGEKARGGKAGLFGTLARRVAAAALLVLTALPALSLSAADAAAENRSLKLYFVHTGEKAVITFKRNGRYDQRGLAQINQFLRDWRKNEPAKMDPRLFDLVWEVYRRSGATDYIHVVSAYRSPATNNMLRTRSRNTGVAKNSQHMLGKAMDFYIPGVKLATLRALAMQMQVGGVGYYPRSGSPFVHLDVGGVRAWPRMTRQELVQIFPNGNTIHLPADGKPLPGYEVALADYKKRVGANSIQIASTAGGSIRGDDGERKRPNLLALLFGGGGADEEEDNAESSAPAVAERPAPAQKPAPQEDEDAAAPVMVASASPQQQQPENIAAPVPLSRPAFRSDAPSGGLATALYSPTRNAAQDALAMQASAPANAPQPPGAETFADLSTYDIPVPTLLGPRGLKGDAEGGVMTASVGQVPGLENMASIPLPAHRPAAPAAPVIAGAQPAPDGQAEDQQALTPALVAALAQSVEQTRPAAPPVQASPVTTPVPSQPPAVASSRPAPAPQPAPAQRPVETAAVSPKIIQPSAGRNMQFGDGFDAPRAPVAASAGAVPVPGKGGRAGQHATRPASAALTGDMLAKWALNNSRPDAAASMKAPRVVSRTLNGEYSAAYAGGSFKPVSATAAIDPGRFSGPAN